MIILSSFDFLCEILLQRVDFRVVVISCMLHRMQGLVKILMRLTIWTYPLISDAKAIAFILPPNVLSMQNISSASEF